MEACGACRVCGCERRLVLNRCGPVINPSPLHVERCCCGDLSHRQNLRLSSAVEICDSTTLPVSLFGLLDTFPQIPEVGGTYSVGTSGRRSLCSFWARSEIGRFVGNKEKDQRWFHVMGNGWVRALVSSIQVALNSVILVRENGACRRARRCMLYE